MARVDVADRPLAPMDGCERNLTDYALLLDGSPPMRAIRTVVENIADTDATVLIRGESGVGKDLVARAIHAASPRRSGPFVKVNCAAIPAGLLEVGTRVIAATNRHLEQAMDRGEFREDLYYRLNVVEIRIPPLRERREEIPLLVASFLARFNTQYRRTKQLSPETMARLREHPWSGNVRELENVIRRMVVLTDGEQAFALVARGQNGHATTSRLPAPVTESLREIERRGARDAERKALHEVL